MKKVTTITCLLMVLPLTGCLLNQPQPGDPKYAPVSPEAMRAPKNLTGSLYQQGYGLTLYDDTRAKQVGDIITVILTEKTTANKIAKSTIKKSADHSLTNPTILGSTPQFGTPGFFPLANRRNNTLATEVETESETSGDASADQSNTLDGSITVVVSEVLPNGNLKIRGEKWITLNTGDEFIRLTGIVRPGDIADDNTVRSDRIADARIAYSGRGAIANSSQPGWLSRFFTGKWWPF